MIWVVSRREYVLAVRCDPVVFPSRDAVMILLYIHTHVIL